MNLSIIIPVYNVENYLEECVLSVYNQSIPLDEFEVILVNDGSTDRSFVIMNQLASIYSNIKVFSQENMGLSAARNSGLQLAEGDYIFFLDSDDFIYQDSLATLLKRAIENDLEVLRFEYLTVDESGKRLSQSPFLNKRVSFENQLMTGGSLFENIIHQDFFVWLFLLKRSFLLKEKISFVKGMFFEDIEYSVALSSKAQRCMYVASCMYGYRQRSNSILHTFSEKKVRDVIHIVSNLQQYLCNETVSKSFKDRLRNVIAHLVVSILLRMSESPIFEKRKGLLILMKERGIICLQPSHGMRDRIISRLYNLMGKHVFWILRPVVLLKMKI